MVRTHSFLRRTGSVGVNLSLVAPIRVVSVGFFARFPMALDGPAGGCEPLPEPDGVDMFQHVR